MKIVLLSGGSGKRLWPLSNDARSKQFLRLLTAPDGSKESMIQRVVRQIKSAGLTDEIVIATGLNQRDSIENQLGDSVSVVTEPCRRDTFPAIMLACAYLSAQGVPPDEPIIVMPCDSYTESGYFTAIAKMAEAVSSGIDDMVLMGIEPTYPSAKYGYIVPDVSEGNNCVADVMPVKRFTEKPDVGTAEKLIAEGALWNGGVFAFRLGYLMNIVETVKPDCDFTSLRNDYANLPKISFDYAVVEKATSVGVVPYSGQWKDLGTWNTLTDELESNAFGNVHEDATENCYIINELEHPIVCIGAKDLVIAASPDGILVTDRKQSENIKHLVDGIGKHPMYEERRWGEYKVIGTVDFPDGYRALTKQINVRAGCSINDQVNECIDEVWTLINGEGEIVLDGERKAVKRGDVVSILRGCRHTLHATTPLTLIAVQQINFEG